jgi:hypothetical protein
MSIAVGIVVGGCAGSVTGPRATGTTPDAGDAAIEGGTIVGECTTDSGCPMNATCVFAIGSCFAKGLCYENAASEAEVAASGCGAMSYLCGCNGATVTAGCATFDGGTGPTTGAQSLTNGFGPDYCPDAAGGTPPDANACAACAAGCYRDPLCLMNCGCLGP